MFQYLYQVKVEGIIISTMLNEQPQAFSNLKIYTGDPWYEPMKGSLRNLEVSGEHFQNNYYVTAKLN